MRSEQLLESFGDYLTVRQAATLLGVSSSTLRNWDRQGKLVAARHPLNSYRLYQRDALLQLLRRLKSPPRLGSK